MRQESEALNVAPATQVANALVVTSEAGKVMGEKSKSQNLNQLDAPRGSSLGEYGKREASPLVRLAETDAQYLPKLSSWMLCWQRTNAARANDFSVAVMSA